MIAIAKATTQTCPVIFVESLSGEHEEQRTIAMTAMDLFEAFPPEAHPLLWKAVGSADADIRQAGLRPLASLEGTSERLLKTIRTRCDDPDIDVRVTAQHLHYELTDDLDQYVAQLVARTADPPEATTQAEKDETAKTKRALRQLGTALIIYNLAREKPKPMAEAFTRLLSHDRPPIRQAAIRHLDGMCRTSRLTFRAVDGLDLQPTLRTIVRNDKDERVAGSAKLLIEILDRGLHDDLPETPPELTLD